MYLRYSLQFRGCEMLVRWSFLRETENYNNNTNKKKKLGK